MVIDFSPIHNGETTYLEFSKQFSVQDLKNVTNDSTDHILNLIKDLDDQDVTFDPVDPEANDPDAVAGEENIGWSIAHLVAHVTASSEEWAAYSSILARGIVYPKEPRLRYETAWRDIKTKAQTVQRLEESRRMRLAYLDTWPDQPHLDIKREMSERFVAKFGEMNAPAALLFGLSHEVGHYEQIREVARQALAAKATT